LFCHRRVGVGERQSKLDGPKDQGFGTSDLVELVVVVRAERAALDGPAARLVVDPDTPAVAVLAREVRKAPRRFSQRQTKVS